MKKSIVYFTPLITSDNLVHIYQALNTKLEGNVAVKVHSGEPGGNHYLKPTFMEKLIHEVAGTIVECNTAYEGRRMDSIEHWKTIREHGFSDIAPFDLLDEEGQIALPIENGTHLTENYVGSHYTNYDSLLVLSHFKGHQMGGFGGALKNISIGLASSYGKAYIHGAGNPEAIWTTEQNPFLEAMAEAAKTIVDDKKDQLAFINVMCDLSIDCDCNANPHAPEMKDIGILASLDPVALDQACVDFIYASEDSKKASLIARIEEKNGVHLLEEAERLGIGSRIYDLIQLDF